MMPTTLRSRSDHNSKFSLVSSRANATIPQQEQQSTYQKKQLRSDLAVFLDTAKSEPVSSKDEPRLLKIQKSESKKSLWSTLKNEVRIFYLGGSSRRHQGRALTVPFS